MLTKREFDASYSEAVAGIKKLKASNDQLTKNMGVVDDIELYFRAQAQREDLQASTEAVSELVGKLEKSYLDPDTARKIGIVRQQFRAQQDRRKQLLVSIAAVTTTPAFHQYVQQKQAKSTPMPIKNQLPRGTDYYRRKPPSADTQAEGQNQIPNYIQEDYDHEAEASRIRERGRELREAHQKLVQIQGLVQETENMVYFQGEKIDIIGDDLSTGLKNVELATEELKEANKKQKKSKKKIYALSFLVLLLLALLSIFAFVL